MMRGETHFPRVTLHASCSRRLLTDFVWSTNSACPTLFTRESRLRGSLKAWCVSILWSERLISAVFSHFKSVTCISLELQYLFQRGHLVAHPVGIVLQED